MLKKCYNSQLIYRLNALSKKYMIEIPCIKIDSLTCTLTCIRQYDASLLQQKAIHNKRPFSKFISKQLPFKNGFAVFTGLERIVNYLEV